MANGVKGITAATTWPPSTYIAPSTGTTTATASGPFMNPVPPAVLSSYAYQIQRCARTAPYNLYSPGNYNLDLAMVRSFPLHLTESSS